MNDIAFKVVIFAVSIIAILLVALMVFSCFGMNGKDDDESENEASVLSDNDNYNNT